MRSVNYLPLPGRWESRRDSIGNTYEVWEPGIMARIPDELIGCVFFLYPSLAEAKANASVGASGFFVGIEWESNQLRQHLYAVTNKHCITKCRDHVVLRATKIGGDLEFIESDPIEWHPLAGHDVSVFP